MNGGIIKENDAENWGAADGNDRRGQEDLRGTAGRVQGRQGSTRNNQNKGQGQKFENGRSQGGFRVTLLTDKEIDNYESINHTIHADEWQSMSDDLQFFSNVLNEARAANKHGAFVDKKSPQKLQGAKATMTADGPAGCAVFEMAAEFILRNACK